MQECTARNGATYYRSTLEELLESSTLKPLVSGNVTRLGCPIHRSDRQRSLQVNQSTGSFRCYSCGAWGYLDDGPGIGVFTPRRAAPQPKPVVQERQDLRQLMDQWWELLEGSAAIDYLNRRRVPIDTALASGLGYCPRGRWPGRPQARAFRRVAFPLDAPTGELIGLYSRAIDPDYPDGKAHKDARHDILGNRGLFNGFVALRIASFDGSLYITEGAFDCLAMLEADYSPTAALIGTDGMPWDWLRGIRDIYFCLDRDGTGTEKALELARQAALRGIRAHVPGPDAYGGFTEPSEQYEAEGRVTL